MNPGERRIVGKMSEEIPKLEAKQRKKSVVITFRADPELYSAFRSALLGSNSSKSKALRELMQKYIEGVANAGRDKQEPQG